MSDNEEAGFAFVRAAECAALMRCRPSAALAFIFIRSVLATREGHPFLCGSRDFKPCGLGRDAAERALEDLEREGLIRRVSRGDFTRGKKASWQIIHTREGGQNTAGKPANCKSDTAGLSANSGRKTRQLGGNTAGLPATPKDTPAPAEQEQGAGVSSSDKTEVERDVDLQAQKERARRIERGAKAALMSDFAFIRALGGPQRADFLARKLDRGDITPEQLRARVAASEEEALDEGDDGPSVHTIAIGGAA